MKIASLECFVVGVLVFGSLQSVLSGDATAWRPADGPLMTRWAKDVAPDRVHPEYPRPQMVRPQWANLNGLWNYTIQPKDQPKPADWGGKILVPFCVESTLSGVMKSVGSDNRLWYQRQFHVPEWAKGQRLLLHFDAVDWHAQVWVNGRSIGGISAIGGIAATHRWTNSKRTTKL